MPELNRRGFLIGLFGAAVVAAAGPIPKALVALPDDKFQAAAKKCFDEIKAAASSATEIWCDGKNYSFVPLPGFKPMREESDRLATRAINTLYANYRQLPATSSASHYS